MMISVSEKGHILIGKTITYLLAICSKMHFLDF